MRTRQKRPKTAVDQCLSILLRNTRDFELQLFELNKLRYQVWQAELSARNRARSALRSLSAKPAPAAFLESCRGLSADQRPVASDDQNRSAGAPRRLDDDGD